MGRGLVAAAVDLALVYLRWQWGEFYEIRRSPGVWRARRRDSRTFLVAGNAAELRAVIVADYTAQPVARIGRAEDRGPE
jgi:hypothetical protein